jgi:hypothetical protein
MTVYHGKDGVVKSGANTVAETTNFQVTISADLAEKSAQGDGWKSRLAGMKDAQGTVECRLDAADTNGQQALTAGAEITLGLYPDGDAGGRVYLSGPAIIGEVTRNSTMGDVNSRSFTFSGNGEWSEAAV